MRARAALLALVMLAAGAAWARPAAAQATKQTPQERQRQEILKELGLEKKPPPPPAPAAPPPPAGPNEARDAAGAVPDKTGPAAKGARGTAAPAAAAPSFRRAVHPLLVATCKACHTPGAPAGASRLLLSGDAGADHAAVARFADVRNPEASALLTKASGAVLHGGGAPWPAASAPHQRVLDWIRGGARLDKAGPEAQPVAAAPPAPGSAPRRATTVAPAPPTLLTPAAPPAPPPPGIAAPPAAAAPVAVPPTSPAAPALPSFAATAQPVLTTACAACHRAGAPAGMTRLLLSGDATRDEAAARLLVDPAAPEASLLVTKAAGEMHGGGPVLPPGDARLATLVAWIRGLAPPPAPTPAPTAPATAGPLPTPAPVGHPVGASPHAGGPPGAPPGYALPLGFLLNGRFSLEYERRQFTGAPSDGVNALRSYHHFLFLSHEAPGDPCGVTLEILTLQFWEAHCRVPSLPGGARLTVAGGKIVVPFGADPLYHQSYGGLAGFDQPILPVIWAVEGVAGHLVVSRGPLVITDDLFVVRGYGLAKADAVLNLQNDFSPTDDVKLGWGNRLGVAWMWLSAWYSAYYNPLGFGRRLFMQALDVTVWRPRGIPIAQHFSLGGGLFRADVSGGGDGAGGAGLDYYHFGSYLQLRYYPTDWLYIQYRQGLRTFNNRLGVIVDNSRLTSADASTHNFAIVARHRGLSLGLYYFINMEKADELPNDLVRLSGVYEF